MATQTVNTTQQELAKPQTKLIWRTFWILLAITALEFLIAFTVPAGTPRTIIFVLMTLVKAFYIVSEFMHLKGEVKTLIWCIIIPTIFVMWFIAALLIEGGSVHEMRPQLPAGK
jgi:cytochrome c oxidase subunit IV